MTTAPDMKSRARRNRAIVLCVLVCPLLMPTRPAAQRAEPDDTTSSAIAADVNARLTAFEHAQGVLLGALMQAGPQPDPADLLQRVTRRLSDPKPAPSDPDAERGFAALGAAAA